VTTVAYRDGVLATDSRGVSGDIIADNHCQKLFVMQDGSLVAAAGNYSLIWAFVNWMYEGDEKVDRPEVRERDTAVIIHLDAAGRLWEFEGHDWAPCVAPFYAWGSGAMAALAAMHLGATAEEAVLTAIQVDPNSGGAVQAKRLVDSVATVAENERAESRVKGGKPRKLGPRPQRRKPTNAAREANSLIIEND
jgi:hypothetical protein